MNSNGKKISFLFNKLSKKPNAFSSIPKEDKSVEFIDCLEGTEIKVKNAVEKIEKAPLVIPIKGDANNIVSQIERESLKNKKIKTETSSEDLRPDSELTIEELAARQLLREARNKLEQNKDTTKIHSLPLEDNAAVQDGIEPSMDDYESVPIEDFGLACLRGMGWKEGMSIGKNQSKCVKPPEPNLRPKGLGLGAQKILDIQNKDVFDKNGKKLVLAKGVFAKIVAGSQKGKLCEVQFCDEWSGRVAVKLNNTDEIVTLNGLFLVPITKEDFIRESKVINNAKFEQYKLMEENKRGSSHDKIFVDEEPKSSEEKFENRAGTSQIKKEEVSTHKYERMRGDHTIIKAEHSSDEDISVKSESGIDKYETVKKKLKESSTKEFNRESKYDYERTRSKEKYIDQNMSKYGKDSKDCNTSNTMNKSSTSDSSDDSDKRKHAKPEKSRSKPEKWHSERRKSKTKNSSRSEESPDEYERKKSKIRNRSRSRSSSIEYDRKYREKTDKYRKDSKDKRRGRDYSDDDYEENRNSRKCNKNATSRSEKSPEEYGRKKSKIRNRSRSRSSSIEYNRKYREKTDEYMKYSKEKRSGRDSSRYSDDDYEEKRNSRKSNKDSREEIQRDKNTQKSKKKKSHKKRRDSSSESDYSKEKIKHKSRH